MADLIIRSAPPNYPEIIRVFPQATRQTVIFAYAPNIYAPHSRPVPPELIAHEKVHIARQEAAGVDRWWARYLVDPEFRYTEEVLAHRAEYRALCEMNDNRHARRSALKSIAKKLAAPLYGNMVSVAQAMEDIAT